MTFILGLTGSIATGKSTAARYFKKSGIPVVDSDLIAREVVEPGKPGLKKVVAEFGTSILNDDGSLNRKALGAIVFSDPNQRKKLDQILADELNLAISHEIADWVTKDVPLLVVDVPLLYEVNYQEKMTEVMVIYVPETIQLDRLMGRDNLSKEEAQKRIASQLSIEKKKELADIVIDNSDSVSTTEKQLADWLSQFS